MGVAGALPLGRLLSSASALACGNIAESERGCDAGIDSSIVAANGDWMAATSAESGRPVTCTIFSIWFIVDVP